MTSPFQRRFFAIATAIVSILIVLETYRWLCLNVPLAGVALAGWLVTLVAVRCAATKNG